MISSAASLRQARQWRDGKPDKDPVLPIPSDGAVEAMEIFGVTPSEGATKRRGLLSPTFELIEVITWKGRGFSSSALGVLDLREGVGDGDFTTTKSNANHRSIIRFGVGLYRIKKTYLAQNVEPLLAPSCGAKDYAEKPRENNFGSESLHLPVILPISFLEAPDEKPRSFGGMKGRVVLKEYSQSHHQRSHEQE